MTTINDRLNAVAEFGDVVPACVVSLCGDASAEIVRLQAQVDALRHEVSERRVVSSAQLDVIDALAGALGDAMAQIRISPVLSRHPETAEVLSRGAAALNAIGR